MISPSKAVVAAIQSLGTRSSGRPVPQAMVPAPRPPEAPGERPYAANKGGHLGRIVDIQV